MKNLNIECQSMKQEEIMFYEISVVALLQENVNCMETKMKHLYNENMYPHPFM